MTEASWVGLAVALGCGLLVGLERERRKGRGPTRRAAGIRTFTLASLAGAMAQALAPGLLVVVGALAVVALAAIAYLRSHRSDPGLTTELALVVMYLVGVQCVVAPVLGAACGTVLAVLLAAREGMHRFATELLSARELRDALVLASIALVLLPLAPRAPVAWLGGLAPRTLGLLVLLILSLQAAAHVARRLVGARPALALTGFLGGFVSSTATVASMGARARSADIAWRAAAGAATLSGAATWLQSLAIAALVQTSALAWLAGPALAGTGVALAAGSMLLLGAGAAPAAHAEPKRRGALHLREAAWITLLLGAVSVAVTLAQSRFGAAGVVVGAAVAALADAQAAFASVFALEKSGALSRADALTAVLTAVSVNTLTRSAIAVVTGGARFGIAVASALLLSAALAWVVAIATTL